MKRRLMDLGFTKGTTVTCVLCGSGIKAYLVRGETRTQIKYR